MNAFAHLRDYYSTVIFICQYQISTLQSIKTFFEKGVDKLKPRAYNATCKDKGVLNHSGSRRLSILFV